MPAFTRIVAGLDITQPFIGRWELERRRGRPYKLRLGSNECLFGMSRAAMGVLEARGPELALYADPTHTELRNAIAAKFGVGRGQVVIAEGIEGLLALFVRAFVAPGDVAVTSRGGYPSFDYYVRGCGGRLVHQPYLEAGTNNLEGLLRAAERERAKLVYLANPDNPTGTLLPAHEVRDFLKRLPAGCVLLLDEAYIEFAPAAGVLPQTEFAPNLVRLRTFSKAYGLAGARVGYAIAPSEITEPLERIRQHFAVSKIAQEMALAALGDDAFVDRVVAETARGRADYAEISARIGAAVLPSAANFVAFDFGDALRAAWMARHLEEHDIAVRRVAEPPLDRLIRITVGPPDARAFLAEVLDAARAHEYR